MPTKREREYYRMGFKDGVESERYKVRDPGGQIRYTERGDTYGSPRSAYIESRSPVPGSIKPKRKLSSWNKFVKANSKKPRFRYKSGAKRGKVNLKALGVAYRKKKRR